MAERMIAKVDKRHYGKYVVLGGLNSTKVVAYDKDLEKAIEKAREKGAKKPIIVFIQDPKMADIYGERSLKKASSFSKR